MKTIQLTLVYVFVAAFVCLLGTSTAYGQLKENLDLPFDAFGHSEDEEEAPDVIYFYGAQYEGDGFFFCLDRSGSTAGGEIEIEKRETIKAIREFSGRVNFAVVFFDKGVVYWPSSGRPAEANQGQKSAATSFVQSMQSGGGSCSKDGLMRAMSFANRSTSERNIVIYLGDAGAGCGGGGGGPEQTLKAVQGANYKKHKVNTLCVGKDISQDGLNWCRTLANQNRGTFKHVPR